MGRILRYILAVFCAASFVRASLAAEPRARVVRETIRGFIEALSSDDIASAQAHCVDDPKEKAVLAALAKSYASDRELAKWFTRRTGLKAPSALSPLAAFEEHFREESVEFGDGVAYSEWGGFSLRQVDGKWKIDLAEYDYDRALTEQLNLFRAEPDINREVMRDLAVVKLDPFAGNVDSKRDELRRQRFGELQQHIGRIRIERVTADARGEWRVRVEPFTGEFFAQPRWAAFDARLWVTGVGFRIETSNQAVRTTGRLLSTGYQMESCLSDEEALAGKQIDQSWSLRYIRILKELRGVVTVDRDQQMERYDVKGVRVTGR